MKKQLLIISGVVLAVAIGIMFYFISIPNTTSAALPGNRTGNRCSGSAPDPAGGTYTWDFPCSTIQEGMNVNCNEQPPAGDGKCSWGNELTGTVGTDTYFTAAHATAFMQTGGTNDQVNAIDGIYRACLGLIASKPTDTGTPIPKSVSCDNVKWACRPNGTIGCQRIDSGAWIGNPYSPETTACNNSNGYGGVCGGSQDGLGCSLDVSGPGTVGNTTVTAAGTPAEFNPSNPGFGTTTLRLGDKGAQVVTLQKFLISQGYTSVVADGSFGAGTEGALKHWEGKHGLAKDGVFGSQARSVATTVAAAPSVNRGLFCQGTWNCVGGAKQCQTNSPANCTVYCVPEEAPANPVCNGVAR